jgi:hypothetical protein
MCFLRGKQPETSSSNCFTRPRQQLVCRDGEVIPKALVFARPSESSELPRGL